MENCKITFYNIDRFGYYRRGHDNPEFGDLAEILDDLREWAFQPDMKLGQTCTYEVSDKSERVSYRTFCFDLVRDASSNTYLLTTWNESPSSQGKVASVRGLDPVGNPEVNLTKIPEDYIPGYATYFWFVPNKDTFATLQFQHNFNGRQSLEVYLRSYLATFSKHVASQTIIDSDSINILGYQKTSSHEVCQDLYPQFNSKPYQRVGQYDYIRNNSQEIRQVIRKDTLRHSVQQNRELWQRLIQTIGISDHSPPNEEFEHRFKFTVNHTPSAQELDEIIRFWNEKEHDSKWDDIGFKLRGEEKIHWLSYSLARNDFPLNVRRVNDEIVDARSLLKQLLEHQEKIFSLLDTYAESSTLH
ncbi:MAG: hypothetical protein HC851_04615 [Acaryochloris sp. RU_4_1]|nr:hypothetical protein [Acaryochloris sp. RU_4_1]NJR56140.1 hypothetical protein [Acaryochloris sp. CRU_2_0]